MTSYARYFPWAALLLATVWLIAAMLPPSDASDALNLQEAAEIPVNDGGRVKPLDTLARTDLMLISGRQAFYLNDSPAPPVQWALDVMTSQDRNLKAWGAFDPANKEKQGQALMTQAILQSPSAKMPAFEIQNAAILADFGKQPRTDLFSFAELVGKFGDFLKQESTMKAVANQKRRETVEQKLGRDLNDAELQTYGIEELTEEERERFKLFDAMRWYVESATYVTPHRVFRIEDPQVLSLLGLEMRSGLRYSIDEFVPRLGPLFAEAERAHKVDNKSAYQSHVTEVAKHVRLYLSLANQNQMRIVPPQRIGGEWLPLQDALYPSPAKAADPHADLMAPRPKVQRIAASANPEADALDKILEAYTFYDPTKSATSPENEAAVAQFNKSLQKYQGLLERSPVRETRRAPFETFFNHFAPFYQCTVLYCLVFLLTMAAFLMSAFARVDYRQELMRAAFWVMVLTLAVHTWAIMARMYLSGRPPVTNLYTSAVFIGWGCVCLASVLELILQMILPSGAIAHGFPTVVGSVLGFITTIIAHYLAQSGDTLEMMQAVLDTNFWLATHVTCVTLGYTATFFAGFLGMLYIGLGLFTTVLDKPTSRILYQITYGVVCFATLLSFVGTVLGGIWADQSWGRFWGWDPKENGALLIVIWNAIILHARWGGMVKERGVAVLAVGGNIVTGWSWFGTNMLGVGLHSYGFMSGALAVLLTFDALFLGFIAMGLMPLRYWNSFGGNFPIPRFRTPVLPSGPLPALAGIGAPAANPAAVTTGQEKPAKNKRGKNGRGVRQ